MKNDIKIIEKWIDENFNYDRPIGILNLNEALNNAKKEINRLQTELNNEISNNKKLNTKIQELLIEKEKNSYEHFN